MTQKQLKFKKGQLVSIANTMGYVSDRLDGLFEVTKHTNGLVYVKCISPSLNKEVETYFEEWDVSLQSIKTKNIKAKINVEKSEDKEEKEIEIDPFFEVSNKEPIKKFLLKDAEIIGDSKYIKKIKENEGSIYLHETYQRIDITKIEFKNYLSDYKRCHMFILEEGIILTTKKYRSQKDCNINVYKNKNKENPNIRVSVFNINLLNSIKSKLPNWKINETSTKIKLEFAEFDNEKCILITLK